MRPRELISGYPTFFHPPHPRELWMVGDGDVAFQNSWSGEAGFYKDDASGRVYIYGNVTNSSLAPSSAIFQLPAGYTPDQLQRFAVPAHDPNGNNDLWTAGIVKVDTNGNVIIEKMPDFSQFVRNVTWNGTNVVVTFNKSGKVDQVHLDGIHFLASVGASK